MPERTSWLAPTTTSKVDRGLPCSRFSRSRRKMFSTSTTASSTSSPMAIARPPSVMVLMDSPIHQNTTAVPRIETGIAVSEITVVRTLSRNANRMMATTTIASIRTVCTFLIDVSMKLACRNRMLSTLIPRPNVLLISDKAASTARVSVIVSTSGCFSTDRITDDWPM